MYYFSLNFKIQIQYIDFYFPAYLQLMFLVPVFQSCSNNYNLQNQKSRDTNQFPINIKPACFLRNKSKTYRKKKTKKHSFHNNSIIGCIDLGNGIKLIFRFHQLIIYTNLNLCKRISLRETVTYVLNSKPDQSLLQWQLSVHCCLL